MFPIFLSIYQLIHHSYLINHTFLAPYMIVKVTITTFTLHDQMNSQRNFSTTSLSFLNGHTFMYPAVLR